MPFRLVTLVKRSRYSRDVLNEKNELNFYKTNTIYDLMWISFQLSQCINARITFYLTNRFQVVVRLFSNRSQRTPKYGKNKKVTHSAAPRAPLFCSYHILTSSVIYYWTDARQLGIYLFYIIKNWNIRKKSFNDDVIYKSVLQVRTNLNACITELII